MSMYEEIQILVSISHGYFTITWLKPYHVISCLYLCSDGPGRDNIHPAKGSVVAKKTIGRGKW